MISVLNLSKDSMRCFRLLAFCFVTMTAVLFSALNLSLADWREEEKKVEYLLKSIEGSQLKFERNNKFYEAKEASLHLRQKLEAARNSWFAPSREKWTAKMFIDKIATKSSLTGEPYFIIQADGTKISSRDWLNQRLKEFEQKPQ